MGFPPYIEFYSDPRVRFEFATRQEFVKLRYALDLIGKKTVDLA